MSSKIEVSIICNAYNQEKYIAKALEGMVMQETAFPFEILIHDDASTDKTADIIREYEKKFPKLIKPIYDTENLYSKGDGSLTKLQYGRALGRYIAICEGDDYWIDPLKLQKQFDELENHPEINICASAALIEREGKIIGRISRAEENTIFSVEDVILGGGGFVATATLFMRSEIVKEPMDFMKVVWLDYGMQIGGSLPFGMLFLTDETAVRRLSTESSWTLKMKSNNERRILHSEKVIRMLELLNEETDYKYDSAIQGETKMIKYSNCQRKGNYLEALSLDNRDLFKKEILGMKIKIIILALKQKVLQHNN